MPLAASTGRRFMEWGHTNIADLPRNWSERPRPSHRSFAHNKGGVPIEHTVLLANMVGRRELCRAESAMRAPPAALHAAQPGNSCPRPCPLQVGAAPWFSIPHTADDDYQRQFAAQVKASLRPDLRVYVEWSNEVSWVTGGWVVRVARVWGGGAGHVLRSLQACGRGAARCGVVGRRNAVLSRAVWQLRGSG